VKKRIVISINTTWNVYNFRIGLIKALIERGYDVVALAPNDEYAPLLEELGCRCVHLPMDKNGSNPLKDAALCLRYYRTLRSLRPDAFLSYTIKPNVYGSLAAHLLGIPVVNNIAGLGSTFIRETFLTKVVRLLYKVALSRSHRVFFQNEDDLKLFSKMGLVNRQATALVPGSGINLDNYLPEPVPDDHARPYKFLMVARVLKDKGIEEYVEAARLLRAAGVRAEFQLLGSIDAANPNSISAERISQWEAAGLLCYLGKTDDVRPYLASADCVVLPSYREGVPRSLLEAAAMARPIIATNVAGCRDAVDDEVNGFLCEVKNAASLAEKMKKMVGLTRARRAEMGFAGRRKVEAEFDEKLVIHKYFSAIEATGMKVAHFGDFAEMDLSDELNT
jgi:glycosyltransferase involved in cell wall biosynthesis